MANSINGPHVRGMGRYVQELLRHGGPGLRWRLYGENPARPLACPAGVDASADVFAFRGDRFHLWEQLGLPLHGWRDGIDVLHCSEGSLPWWQPVPTVVTVHDTLAWQENEFGGFEGFYLERLLPRAMARCARIVTISQSSGRDIGARWPQLESKVVVIPHGIGPEYLVDGPPPEPSPLQRKIGSRPYIVYVGGPLPRKRFDWALRVLEACGRPELQLVACGFAQASHNIRRQAVPPVVRDRVHFAPFLSDEELRALYSGAMVTLYPTLYEGFGFPAIEAQAAGSPVIFSGVSSLAELVGPLATTVAADDLGAWCAAVAHAAGLGAARYFRAAEARQWAHRFSWQRSLEAHRTVYEDAAYRRR